MVNQPVWHLCGIIAYVACNYMTLYGVYFIYAVDKPVWHKYVTVYSISLCSICVVYDNLLSLWSIMSIAQTCDRS